jgi:hypothetical protein
MNDTTKCKIEKLAIFLGFPILWLVLGSILLAGQNFQMGGLFLGAAGAMSIIIVLTHKKEGLNLQGHIIMQDKVLYVIIAIGSIGLSIAAPYITALSLVTAKFLGGG